MMMLLMKQQLEEVVLLLIFSAQIKAILAGDYLLSETIVRLSKLNNIKVIEATAKTIKDLSVGEWLQSDLINTRNYSDESLREVSLLKRVVLLSGVFQLLYYIKIIRIKSRACKLFW